MENLIVEQLENELLNEEQIEVISEGSLKSFEETEKNIDIETPTVLSFSSEPIGDVIEIVKNNEFILGYNCRECGVAQEPWPKDVKLFQPYEVEQILLPDNANCLAVQAFLKMCQLPFQVEPRANAEYMSPTGKVPFIKAGRFITAELEGIVQFVNSKGISLTDKLDNVQKADMRAYMTLVRNVIEVAELYICWIDKETYNEVTKIRNGSIYPWPLNHIQNRAKRNAVVKKLKVLDWYYKNLAEVYQEVESCCEALSVRLDGKPYFFDEGPTELDALVFGHLFTILTTPLPRSNLADIVRRHPHLISLVQKVENDYFKVPEKQKK